MPDNTIKVKIELVRDNQKKLFEYNYLKRTTDDRPMALDVLLQAQERKIDDLAFRNGCRARNCGCLLYTSDAADE